jgi:hypothetical protein
MLELVRIKSFIIVINIIVFDQIDLNDDLYISATKAVLKNPEMFKRLIVYHLVGSLDVRKMLGSCMRDDFTNFPTLSKGRTFCQENFLNFLKFAAIASFALFVKFEPCS